jgi:hypothetical protein
LKDRDINWFEIFDVAIGAANLAASSSSVDYRTAVQPVEGSVIDGDATCLIIDTDMRVIDSALTDCYIFAGIMEPGWAVNTCPYIPNAWVSKRIDKSIVSELDTDTEAMNVCALKYGLSGLE